MQLYLNTYYNLQRKKKDTCLVVKTGGGWSKQAVGGPKRMVGGSKQAVDGPKQAVGGQNRWLVVKTGGRC